jgi:hypothetical protein
MPWSAVAARDPLSVAYDTRVRRVLIRAIVAHRNRQAATVFIASPPAEFRRLDQGGRTAHERAFTRSAYYQVFKVPRNNGDLPTWSLKLTWGPIRFHSGRWGRIAQVRLFRYGAGYRHAQTHPQWVTGQIPKSTAGARIDS